MSEDQPPPSLDDLDAKLRSARGRRPVRKSEADGAARGGALSLALRLGVEIVAALIVGVGIGLLLDRWLGTAPWMLLLFFVLGSAAGMMNVYRVMSGQGYAAGYRETDKRNGREGPDE